MVIEHVLQLYQDRDPYWSADLMVALEEIRPGLALDWAIDCAKALIDRGAEPRSKEQLLTWLHELDESKSSNDSSSLMEKSDVIWHIERDVIHSTIAHLFVALGHLQQNNMVRYRTSIISAANVMGEHEFYRMSSLKIALSLFEEYIADSVRG